MFYINVPSKALSTRTEYHHVPHIRAINFFILVITALLYLSPVKAEAASNSDSLKPLNRFPRMVQEYFVRSVRRIENRANERRADLKTKADAEAYVRDVRQTIQQSFGPWPQETPLKPRIKGVIEKDTDKIE